MSKKRQLDTAMWHDRWFMELENLEQFLFIYLLSNDHTTIGGVYEIGIRTIEFETKIPRADLENMLIKMRPKVHYIDGWIVMRNGIKNQNLNNSKIRTGIELVLAKVPENLIDYIEFPTEWSVDKPKKPNQVQLEMAILADENVVGNEKIPLKKEQHRVEKKSTSLEVKRVIHESSHSNSNAVANSNPNSNAAPSSTSQPAAGFDKSKTLDKKAYARSVRMDEEQKQRAQKIGHTRASPKTVSSIRETLEAKGIVKSKLKGSAT